MLIFAFTVSSLGAMVVEMKPLALKEAMTMGMEWLAYPLGLYGACFTLQDSNFALVFVSGVGGGHHVLVHHHNSIQICQGAAVDGGDELLSGLHTLLLLGLIQKLRYPFWALFWQIKLFVNILSNGGIQTTMGRGELGAKKFADFFNSGVDRGDESPASESLFGCTPMLVFNTFFGF